jgi:hypothetical protein
MKRNRETFLYQVSLEFESTPTIFLFKKSPFLANEFITKAHFTLRYKAVFRIRSRSNRKFVDLPGPDS